MLQEYEDPLHYFLEDIKDEFAKNILSKKTFDSEDWLGSNSVDLLLEYIQHIYPRKAESNKSALKRISKVKKYIHNLLQSKLNNSSSKMFSQESKIVVVTHGNIGKLWTGKWDKPLDEYEEIPMPSKWKTFDNCQLYADNKNFPRVKTHLS